MTTLRRRVSQIVACRSPGAAISGGIRPGAGSRELSLLHSHGNDYRPVNIAFPRHWLRFFGRGLVDRFDLPIDIRASLLLLAATGTRVPSPAEGRR
jgi:hypothetical protein